MIGEWSDYREYEFTLKDGTKKYDICKSNSDVHAFVKMHNAVKAKPVYVNRCKFNAN